jgi:two-component system NarL family sensor kinase
LLMHLWRKRDREAADLSAPALAISPERCPAGGARVVETFQRVIDVLPEQIALLDEDWNILAVNEAWTATASLYDYQDLTPGSNYLGFCQRKAAEGHSAAAIAAGGVQEVASGAKERFRFVYHGRERWEGHAFQLCIARLEIEGRRFATITRYDVSELVALRQLRTGFSDSLLEVQASERRRLARDVHDSTMQLLVASSLALGRLKRPHNPEETTGLIAEMETLLAQAQRELRSIAYLAHPPMLDQLGLEEALQALVEGYGHRTGLAVSLNTDFGAIADWQPAANVLYRVVQEALSNVHRHAKATEVSVSLVSRKRCLHAAIVDNGVGIELSCRDGVGMPSMRARLQEHGGRLTVLRGSPGTIIIASLPLQSDLRPVGDLNLH